MSFTAMLGYTGEILKRNVTGYDDDGVEEVEFLPQGEIACWLEPFASLQSGVDAEEHLNARDTVTGKWRLLMEVDNDAEAYDRFLAEGRTFEFDGPPETARSPRGPHHLQATLYWIEG